MHKVQSDKDLTFAPRETGFYFALTSPFSVLPTPPFTLTEAATVLPALMPLHRMLDVLPPFPHLPPKVPSLRD